MDNYFPGTTSWEITASRRALAALRALGRCERRPGP
jgi:hypothetical protein